MTASAGHVTRDGPGAMAETEYHMRLLRLVHGLQRASNSLVSGVQNSRRLPKNPLITRYTASSIITGSEGPAPLATALLPNVSRIRAAKSREIVSRAISFRTDEEPLSDENFYLPAIPDALRQPPPRQSPGRSASQRSCRIKAQQMEACCADRQRPASMCDPFGDGRSRGIDTAEIIASRRDCHACQIRRPGDRRGPGRNDRTDRGADLQLRAPKIKPGSSKHIERYPQRGLPSCAGHAMSRVFWSCNKNTRDIGQTRKSREEPGRADNRR